MSILTTLALFTFAFSFQTFEPFHREDVTLTRSQTGKSHDIPYSYYTQKLDHFTPEDPRTFKQRYVLNDKFYKKSHMLIFYINGEAEMSNSRATKGFYYSMHHSLSNFSFSFLSFLNIYYLSFLISFFSSGSGISCISCMFGAQILW